MNRLKRLIKKIIFPRIAVVLICAPIAAALLTGVFLSGSDSSPMGYFSYLFSAYALTILCVRLPDAFKKCSALAHRNRTAHRYLTDIPYRIRLSLYMSLGINIVYAAVKLFAGIYYRSVWFVSLSVYYIMMAVMRSLLLRHNNAVGENYTAELKRYRMCGGTLLIMNIALSGITVLVVHENRGFEYSGILIYAMAAYTFYTTILSVVNLVKYRKFRSPLLSAAKAVNLAAALVSMLSLETAMLAQFGGGDEVFRRNITAVTGAAVCAFVLGMALYMLIYSTARLKRKESEK